MTNLSEVDQTEASESIDDLIAKLGSKNWKERSGARFALVKKGKEATPALIRALTDKHRRIRWEAAKALRPIRDKAAATALVMALMDEVFEVQWLAAEALISLGDDAVVPLLEALHHHADSYELRQGAHHVLHALERVDMLSDEVHAVLESLRTIEPDVTVIGASWTALKLLKQTDVN